MKLEQVVPGSIFDEGPRLGGKKYYTLKKNKNCKKIKYSKQTSSRYRKRVKKRT
jgi:hypothetical protein